MSTASLLTTIYKKGFFQLELLCRKQTLSWCIFILLSLNHGCCCVDAYGFGAGIGQKSSNQQIHSLIHEIKYPRRDDQRLHAKEFENRQNGKEVSIFGCRLAMSQRQNQDHPLRRAAAAPFSSDEQKKNTMLALKELEYLVRTVYSLAQSPIDGGCPWTAEQSALDILGYLGGEVEEIRAELD